MNRSLPHSFYLSVHPHTHPSLPSSPPFLPPSLPPSLPRVAVRIMEGRILDFDFEGRSGINRAVYEEREREGFR